LVASLLPKAHSKKRMTYKRVRISDVFELNIYKLMMRSDYDFSEPTSLGHVIEAKPYRLNNTRKIIKGQGVESRH